VDRALFQELVEDLVADIPPGRVMTYGDLAAACGRPGAARQVGAIARQGEAVLPWHRVVRADGRLALVGDPAWQPGALAEEGVGLDRGRVADFAHRRWYPGDQDS
jgi:methylated-DNA-protein-cysteine methyltransferase-like protein